MQLDQFFTDHYVPERLFGRSKNTPRLYRYSLAAFSVTLGRSATLDDLTNANLAKHMQRVIDSGLSRATANKDRAQLLAIWRHAVRISMLDRWPNVPEMNEPSRVPVAWMPDEVARLLRAIDALDGDYHGVPRSLWWSAMVAFALDTAERITAIRKAQWGWFSGEWVTVPAEVRKGSKRDKAYRLSPSTLGKLTKIRTFSAQQVFPWPYCPGYIWRVFGGILQSAGLPHGRRDKFHKLRRTTASAVFAAGYDPQDALDHASRRTTQGYLDPRLQHTRQPCDILAEYLSIPAARPTQKRKHA